MKLTQLFSLISASFFFTLSPPSYGQWSVYWEDPVAVDYSGLAPNGGTIIVPMVLVSGDPIPGIGTEFNVTYTISPFNSEYGANHEWMNSPAPENGQDGPILGGLYPTNLYSDLPESNTNPIPLTINGIDYTGNEYQWWQAALSEGYLQYLGSFTVTPGDLPPTPEGYQLVISETGVGYGSWQGASLSDTFVISGFYAEPVTYVTDFGVTTVWNYAAFSATDTPLYPDISNPNLDGSDGCNLGSDSGAFVGHASDRRSCGWMADAPPSQEKCVVLIGGQPDGAIASAFVPEGTDEWLHSPIPENGVWRGRRREGFTRPIYTRGCLPKTPQQINRDTG